MIAGLRYEGISRGEIDRMVRASPAKLLGSEAQERRPVLGLSLWAVPDPWLPKEAHMGGWGICPGPPQSTAAPWATNGGMWDLFSVVHGLGGAVLGAFGLGLGPVVVVAVGWEVVEHLLKDCIPDSFVHPTQDSLRNSVTDVLMVLGGWLPGRWVRERRLAASTG